MVITDFCPCPRDLVSICCSSNLSLASVTWSAPVSSKAMVLPSGLELACEPQPWHQSTAVYFGPLDTAFWSWVSRVCPMTGSWSVHYHGCQLFWELARFHLVLWHEEFSVPNDGCLVRGYFLYFTNLVTDDYRATWSINDKMGTKRNTSSSASDYKSEWLNLFITSKSVTGNRPDEIQ